MVYALVAVLAAALGAGAAVGLDNGQRTPSTGVSSNQVPGPHSNAGSAGSGPLNQQTVASKVEPGVVDIDAAIQYSGGTSSEGTGMIINTDGLILTNNHVINGARTIRVTLAATGTSYTATVLGYDASQDVALLRIKSATALKPVAVGDSSQVVLGTQVLAFGNAQGRGRPAVASGIINSLNKTISPTDESTGATETLHNMLQTNADIVSGDSGGPLANAAGQVIGMDTANASSAQGSANVLGYAIPINTALAVARQIVTGQASATVQVGVPGFLGVLVPQSTSADPRQQAQQQQQQQQQQGGGAGCRVTRVARRAGARQPGLHQQQRGHLGAHGHRPGQFGRARRRRPVRDPGGNGRAGQRRRGHRRERAGGDDPELAHHDDEPAPAGGQGDAALGEPQRPAEDEHAHAGRRPGPVSPPRAGPAGW